MTDQGEKNENRGERTASGSQWETVVRPPVFPSAEYARSLFKRHDMTTALTPLSQKILSRYTTSQKAVHGKATDLPLVQAKQSWGFEQVAGSNPGIGEKKGEFPASGKPVVQARVAESGASSVNMKGGLPPVQAKKPEANRVKSFVNPVDGPVSQKIGMGMAGTQNRRSMRDTHISLSRGDGRIQHTPTVQGVMGEGMAPAPTLRQMAQSDSRGRSTESVQESQGVVIKPETSIQRKAIETSSPDMVTRRGTTSGHNVSPGHKADSTSEALTVSESRQSPMTGITAEPAEQTVGAKGYEPMQVVSSVKRAAAKQADDRTAMVFRKETGGDGNGDAPDSSSDAVIKSSAQGDGPSAQSGSRSSEVKAVLVSSVVQAKPMENVTSRLPLVQSTIRGTVDNNQGVSADRRPSGLGSGLIQTKQSVPSVILRTQDGFLPGATHSRQLLVRPFYTITGSREDQRPGKTTDSVQRKQDGPSWGPIQTESKNGEFTDHGKDFPLVTAGYALESAGKTDGVQAVQRAADSSIGFSGSYGQAMDMPMPLGLTQGRVVEKVVQRVENNLNRRGDGPSSRVSLVQTPALTSTSNPQSPMTTIGPMQGAVDIQAMADQVYALIMERLSVERESLGL